MSDFFNTPKIATEDDTKLRWSGAKPGERFRCVLCGHKFVAGDSYTIVYANDLPHTYGNPICCTAHGNVEQLRAAYAQRCEEFRTSESDRFWFFHRRT
jgi:hypothetical protein